MFKKLIITCLSVIMLITFNVNAASDGELILQKKRTSRN